MFFKKNVKQTTAKFCLSENAVAFIKKFAINALNINSPINEETLERIIDLATQWELDMIDPLSKDGCDKTCDYPDRERNEAADKFVSEITGQWNDEKLVPDFDDLNKRLGLIR